MFKLALSCCAAVLLAATPVAQAGSLSYSISIHPGVLPNNGAAPSLTMGDDGLPLLAFFDAADSTIKVLHCNDLACTTGTTTRIASMPGWAWPGAAAVTIGRDGLGLIAYYDVRANVNDLVVAHCTNRECTGATTTSLDRLGDVGSFPALALGADGLALIAYHDEDNGRLKTAHCNDVSCTSATLRIVDNTGHAGVGSSVAIGADGLPLIAYFHESRGDLRVAHCADVRCDQATLYTVDSAGRVGAGPSLAIGSDGLGLISYLDLTNNTLKTAHCLNEHCSSAAWRTLSRLSGAGTSTSLIIGDDGLGLIAFDDPPDSYDRSKAGGVKVAHCANRPCATATTVLVSARASHGALTLGEDGMGVVALVDPGGVGVMHCSNPFCVPYVRRR